ncbi:Wings apart-like protein [Drosera capensis]
MMVRTYGRRNRGLSRTYSQFSDEIGDDSISGSFSLSQDLQDHQDHEINAHEIYNFTFSSQDSARWTLESDPATSNSSSLYFLAPDGFERKAKRMKCGRKRESVTAAATTTLMEAQEFGEMRENMDEMNFALDGLRKGQPVRVRQASLLSLLSICGTASQRRMIRAQGIAKTIIDAILGLSLDDLTCNLAAAALFYILTDEGQDEYPLDSSSSIQFLLKLLKPVVSETPRNRAPAVGHRLLSFQKHLHAEQGSTTRLGLSSSTIISKVKEILIDSKDLEANNGSDDGLPRPELNARWVGLLTIEKASLSSIAIEDTSGAVRKSSCNFKEKLRELGGLDAVFELAISFHSIMEGWLQNASLRSTEPKEDDRLENLALLLKCLKIMENATFLSQENQRHLLGMKQKLARRGSFFSFVKLIISFIKILSATSSLETARNFSNAEALPEHTPVPVLKDWAGDSSIQSSRESSSNGGSFSERASDVADISQRLSSSRFSSLSLSCETPTSTRDGVSTTKIRPYNPSSGSFSFSSRSSDDGAPMANGHSSRKQVNCNVGSHIEYNLDDSQDPFAFDVVEYEPSKWDVLSGRKKRDLQKPNGRPTVRGIKSTCMSETQSAEEEPNTREFKKRMIKMPQRNDADVCASQSLLSQEDTSIEGNAHSSQTSCSSVVSAESTTLLADCLLTAVKVLMNLANDNAEGCQQIAAAGGLETLTSLIVRHFPSFSSTISQFDELREMSLLSDSVLELGSQTDVHLNDQELDFLVAILGLLVNLIEKDSHNRSRLAAATVLLPSSHGMESETHTDVIPLLCSVFLANQGAGEAAEEGQNQQLEDAKEVVLRGEKEAEKMIVEAYSALLLAFLSTERSIRDTIADYLPDNSLAILVPVLERFVAFHLALDMISADTHQMVSEKDDLLDHLNRLHASGCSLEQYDVEPYSNASGKGSKHRRANSVL